MNKPTAAELATAAIAWIRAEDELTEFNVIAGPEDEERYLELAGAANEAYMRVEAMARELANE